MFTNILKANKPQTKKKSDHEIFMEELFQGSNKEEKGDKYKSIFKYESINEYKSIHQYDKLHRQNGAVENGKVLRTGCIFFVQY